MSGKSAEEFITTINSNLDSQNNRSDGLRLLKQIGFIITEESLIKNFPHWMTKFTALLKNQYNPEDLFVLSKTLLVLIQRCKKIPELDKKISIDFVKHWIGLICPIIQKEESVEALNLLQVLIFYYPEASLKFKSIYGEFLSKCIDNQDELFTNSAAKTYALLVRASERSSKNSSNSSTYQLSNPGGQDPHRFHISHQVHLCRLLCVAFTELDKATIKHAVEFHSKYEESSSMNLLNLPELSQHNLNAYYSGLETRIINLCLFLSELLRAPKNPSVRPGTEAQTILSTLQKGLKITTDDNLIDLVNIRCSLLNVLSSLIIRFHKKLLCHSSVIHDLILHTLNCSSKCTNKSSQRLRGATYDTLSIWIKYTGMLSHFEVAAEHIEKHIFNDLEDMTRLKKHNDEKCPELMEKDISFDKSYIPLATKVLQAVHSIILNVNYILKPITLENITKQVLGFSFKKFQLNIKDEEFDKILLQLLCSIENIDHPSRGSLIQEMLPIFKSICLNNCRLELKEEAQKCLNQIMTRMYPTSPSLTVKSSCNDA
ncbi:hypothetical protein TKK_0015958 [Trichogramma kaykai]|uniref:Pre-rRNA-processing protein Ipi1 N-terminal domain-containing protein n=1 Tax=Trichogramma kaykai TaxID=54128 RepID=A0ABD2W9P2_9HYME